MYQGFTKLDIIIFFENKMFDLWLHIIAIASILVFSLYSTLFFLVSRNSGVFVKFVATLVLVMTVVLIIRRDTYLPFLGYAAFPSSLVPDGDVHPKNATKEVELVFDEYVKDGTTVIYWGALPSDDVARTPQLAYGNFNNTGVTKVSHGKAMIKFACPGEYYVPSGKKLNRHIHYRLCCEKYGMLGPVQTAYVRC